MNLLKFLLVGFVFGIILTKSEAVSWYRIFEMFHFDAFHMFGIIGTAIFTGVVGLQIIKRFEVKSIEKKPIIIQNKEKGFLRYLIGGTIFGLGWGLVGACPGPIFILIGAGFWQLIFVFIGALFGTFLYGVINNRLPH